MLHLSAPNSASKIRLENLYDTPDNVWEIDPSIAGVANTGFCIRDVTDSANRLVIDGSGNVGIGTDSPSVGLQVGNATSGETKTVIFNSEGGAEHGLTVQSRTNRAKIRVKDNDTTAYIVAEGGLAYFGRTSEASTSNIAINSDGNVGIGTSSIAYKLDVNGSLSSNGNENVMRIAAADSSQAGGININSIYGDSNTDRVTTIFSIDGQNQASPLAFGTGTTERFRIASDGSLSTPTLGASNVRFGANAGNSIASCGNYNTVIGDEAGTAITTGYQNVAIGYQALDAEDTGGRSVAIGVQALLAQNNDSSNYNTAVGYVAGQAVSSGKFNTLIGGLAGDSITTGSDNVALGYNSLSAGVESFYNTAIGKDALASDTTGRHSVAVGRDALTSQNNAGSDDMYNVAVGSNAGYAVSTGIRNTLIGGLAGDALTDADNNVALGYGSLTTDTLGSRSVAIGNSALEAQNFTSATNVYNTAVGHFAGGSVTTGVRNTLIGSLAGDALTVGDNNVALGFNALSAETQGDRNIAIGTDALAAQNNTSDTDAYNIGIGFQAGVAVTTGTRNTFVGSLAGDATDDGSDNTGLGFHALGANCGNYNTSVGIHTLSACTGAKNTAMGHAAGLALTSGENCLFLGNNAGRSGSPGGEITTGSNEIVLGDENITESHIQVDWTVASDQRDKTDFTALDLGLDFVKALAPVTYKWDKRSKYGDKTADDYDLAAQTPDGTHKEDWLDIGFKAQEVEALEIAAGYDKDNKTNLTTTLSGDGKQYGLQYSKFVPILVKAIQELSAKNEALLTRIEVLENNA
jgi:hypothetical protein